MSFRGKLILFFVLVVVVPMTSVAFVLFRLIDDNEGGKADSRLASRQTVTVNLTGEQRRSADRVAETIASDARTAAALRDGDQAALLARLRVLARSEHATRIAIVRKGAAIADTGGSRAIFPSLRVLVDSSGRNRGTLEVAITDARRFSDEAGRLTGLDVAVSAAGRTLGSTLREAPASDLPVARGTAALPSGRYRAVSFDEPGFVRQSARVTLLEPTTVTGAARHRSRMLIGSLLAGFFLLAITLALFIARSLHRQIETFLGAARRVGVGDFSARVDIRGRDDFALLGGEFNKMSTQLEQRVEDLRVERERLQGAMRNIGEAIASNLDRDGLLEVVVSAAADGVGAGAGRASLRRGPDGPLVTVASTGDVRVFSHALGRAEAHAFATGLASEIDDNQTAALALPLRGRSGATAAVVAIAREGKPFTAEERELFDYLASQAATSIENVDLHERVERQAVTDGLTGLANRRRFEERLGEEVDRSKRFPEPVGLLMIDIDDFKRVNDQRGHLAGDAVLRQVGRLLREAARDIDLAARFGGEELALVLPGATIDGAARVAERVRQAVQDSAIEVEEGPPVRVTVSIGVASLGEGPADAAGLVAAADDALYVAKRTGKNRTERASTANSVSAE